MIMSKTMSAGQPVSDILDMAHLFFVNVSLLGFDASAMERKHRIPFNKDMFSLPNKKGFEVVIHFLFSRLDSARCREQFRDCWPISDKKEEQLFRKSCTNWLEQIAKDDPQSYLPRIGASLFMSPGGDKFNQFLFCFSRYVLYHIIVCENGARAPADFPSHPMLQPSNSTLAVTMANTSAANAILLEQQFIKVCQQLKCLQDEWVAYADELTKEYRSQVRRCRDLEHELKAELSRLSESKLASSEASSKRHKRSVGITEYDTEIQAVQRAQAVQLVRDLWKSFEEFKVAMTANREVVESIVHRTVEKYRIDATELAVKLPDLLLRECEQEIQRRNVDNIYKEGKLNLLSVIHLWNLSLHLYIERMHEVGIPHLDEYNGELNIMLQTHRSHLASAESNKKDLEFTLLPNVKQSVARLRRTRDSLTYFNDAENVTSLGLGLMSPAQQVSFEPHEANGSQKKLAQDYIKLQNSHVSTPEGVSSVLADVDSIINSKHDSSLAQGQPVYGPRIKTEPVSSPFVAPTVSSQPVGRARMSSAFDIKPPIQAKRVPPLKAEHVPLSRLSQTAKDRYHNRIEPSTADYLPTTSGGKTSYLPTASAGDGKTRNLQSDQKVSAVVNRHASGMSASRVTGGMSASRVTGAEKRHLDLLVDRVVSTVMSDGVETDDHFDPVREMGMSMFQSGDKVIRTPPLSSSVSGPPLSSTHIDTNSNQLDNVLDPIAIRLFDLPSLTPAATGVRSYQADNAVADRSSPPSSIHSVSTEDLSRHSSSGDNFTSLLIAEIVGDEIQSEFLIANSDSSGRLKSKNTEDEHFIRNLGVDCLDETIQSLLDTKTPLLPSRVRANASDRTAFGFRARFEITEKPEHTPTISKAVITRGIERQNSISNTSKSSAVANSVSVVPSHRTLESSADLDNIIARYRNIRVCAAPSEIVDSALDLNLNARADSVQLPSDLRRLNVEEGCGTENSLRKRYALAGKDEAFHDVDVVPMRVPHDDDVAVLSLNPEMGLYSDKPVDVLQDLIDISLEDDLNASTPRLQQQDSSELDLSKLSFTRMPLSPFTDAIHKPSREHPPIVDLTRFEITTRLSDFNGCDILGEDCSVLIPASPAENNSQRNSIGVHAVNLVDLSY